MTDSITCKLARLIKNSTTTDITIINESRKLIIDYIAASYAGYQYNIDFNRTIEQIYFDIHGIVEASVFNSNITLPPCNAAFINAVYAHGADIDDGHRGVMGHIGASVISAVFALADTIETTEQDVLIAIIIGYEVFIRIARAAQPGIVRRGFHSSGVVGSLACAAACSRLLDLSEEQIVSAISMAATQSSGLLIVGETGQLVKPLSPARAAEAGLFSALLAQKGIIGPERPLESIKGWFHAMSEHTDVESLFNGFEKLILIKECYVKPYPACRHTHCEIEAAIMLHNKIDISKIKSINVYTYQNAINLAGVIQYPKNIDEAKFSIYYTLACSLFYGEFGFSHLLPRMVDSKVSNIISKIELLCDSSMEDIKKGIRGATVEIFNLDGKINRETILIPKGEPEFPMSMEDIRIKMRQCSSKIISEKMQKNIIDYVMRFGGNNKFRYRNIFMEWGVNCNEY